MRKDDDDDIYSGTDIRGLFVRVCKKCKNIIQKVLRVLLQAFTHTHKLHLH